MREGRGILLFGVFFFFGFVFLPGCALLTRSSKEGRSQPGRERRERVRLRVSTLNAGKPPPPPQLEQKTNVT